MLTFPRLSIRLPQAQVWSGWLARHAHPHARTIMCTSGGVDMCILLMGAVAGPDEHRSSAASAVHSCSRGRGRGGAFTLHHYVHPLPAPNLADHTASSWQVWRSIAASLGVWGARRLQAPRPAAEPVAGRAHSATPPTYRPFMPVPAALPGQRCRANISGEGFGYRFPQAQRGPARHGTLDHVSVPALTCVVLG